MTDIKVTSITQPKSSCPFKNARQKIYGLGYNLLIFVYEKHDTHDTCTLNFKYCTFINNSRTADYTITKRLREMIDDGANKEDIIGFLIDRNVPGDEIVYNDLAEYIEMMNFNANKVFGISASACLLILKLTSEDKKCGNCLVTDIDNRDFSSFIKCENGVLTSLNDGVCDFSGICQYEW